MSALDSALHSIGKLEELAGRSSPVHRIDSRAKLLTVMAFIITVTSFDNMDLVRLLPLALYPVFLVSLGDIPASVLWKRTLIVSPFAVFIGIFNPIFDREVVVQLGTLDISGGWLSFTVIMVKFFLTVTASLLLIATTGFYRVCAALRKLKVPEVFVTQLLFMYRYIFLMIQETSRASRAHSLRAFRKRGMNIRIFASFTGQLLLRTLERAHRIYTAMTSRGFHGDIPILHSQAFRFSDCIFSAGWIGTFIILRIYNLPEILGSMLTGGG